MGCRRFDSLRSTDCEEFGHSREMASVIGIEVSINKHIAPKCFESRRKMDELRSRDGAVQKQDFR